VSVALAVTLVIAAAGMAYAARSVLLSHLRARCPGCQRRELAHRPAAGSLLVMYRCAACGARWVACGGGLITHEAFAAGAREPIPVARLASRS
jgi:hypothetical protein